MDDWHIFERPFNAASDELQRLIEYSALNLKWWIPVVATVVVLALGNGLVVVCRRINKLDPPRDTRRGERLTLAVLFVSGVAALGALRALGWSWQDLGVVLPDFERVGLCATVFVCVVGVVTLGFAVYGLSRSTSEVDAASPRLKVIRLISGTVFGEEAIHRGFLLAIWCGADSNTGRVVAINAVVFGLWHVAGAYKDKRFSCLSVAGPAVGAVLFLWGRLAFGSLLIPMLLHAATNMPGLALEGRRKRPKGTENQPESTSQGA